MPKFRSVNIDGAYFGSSFPHVFLKHYPEAVILPPKVFYYEPKIFGFNVYKKRGSKYFEPTSGTIRYIEDSLTGVEREKLLKQVSNIKNTLIISSRLKRIMLVPTTKKTLTKTLIRSSMMQRIKQQVHNKSKNSPSKLLQHSTSTKIQSWSMSPRQLRAMKSFKREERI